MFSGVTERESVTKDSFVSFIYPLKLVLHLIASNVSRYRLTKKLVLY